MLVSTSLALLVLAQATAAAPATPPPPPCSAAENRQMDFWVGEWDLSFTNASGTPGTAINRITRDELGACVITEHFSQPDIAYVGRSHSLYDANKRKWVQTWVDNGGAYFALAGGPVKGQKHSFELKTITPAGPKQIHYRMIWEDVTPDSMVWRWQALQPDGSYTDQWVLNYKRRK